MDHKADKWFEKLREMALKSVQQEQIDPDELASMDIETLIFDIQTYQIELEMQNQELRRSQKELELSRNQLSTLFNMAPSGCIVLDKNGLIVEANHTILIKLGKNLDDLINKPFSKFIHPADQSIFLARFKTFYKNPLNKILEIRLSGPDQSGLTARIEGRLIKTNISNSKKLIGNLLLNLTDISEEKKIDILSITV